MENAERADRREQRVWKALETVPWCLAFLLTLFHECSVSGRDGDAGGEGTLDCIYITSLSVFWPPDL